MYQAQAEKDAAQAELDTFRNQFEGGFDENTELDADQQAEYDELDHAVYEATNRFNLAEVNAQQVNAEQVAKEKAEAREALLEARAEKEIEREDAL
jgi:uncharacterized membrane-anchored protein YhcB (DUF1043 family)